MNIILLLLLSSFSAKAQTAVESILTEEAIHSLRDPFQVPSAAVEGKAVTRSDLTSFELKDIKLNGVITSGKKAKAMVSLPNSKSFFLTVGDRVGTRDGHVVSISGDSIKVIEFDRYTDGKRFSEMFQLKISGDFVLLTKKEEL